LVSMLSVVVVCRHEDQTSFGVNVI
jgi:putative AlgH/UPF0301 family transcriptional regulator